MLSRVLEKISSALYKMIIISKKVTAIWNTFNNIQTFVYSSLCWIQYKCRVNKAYDMVFEVLTFIIRILTLIPFICIFFINMFSNKIMSWSHWWHNNNKLYEYGSIYREFTLKIYLNVFLIVKFLYLLKISYKFPIKMERVASWQYLEPVWTYDGLLFI